MRAKTVRDGRLSLTAATARLPHGALLLVLGLVAAAYFSLGNTLTLEWMDEGQILYPSWRVAKGALPCRDFDHLYPPSLFFFNGALFRFFGADLLVIRAWLVVLKALLAVVVYAGARYLASWPFALAAYGLYVLLWGAPIWIFNTPYANHYSMTLVLLGILVFLSLRQHFLLAAALAGLCFGVASTFKQTAGIFAYASFVLYLVSTDQSASSAASRDDGIVQSVARAVRIAALVGSLGIFIVYLRPANTFWNVFILFTPIALTIVIMALRELRASGGQAAPLRSLAAMASCAAGLILPMAMYALYYARHGLLADFVFTVVGVPSLMKWFVPVPYPDVRAIVCLATVLAAVLLVRMWCAAIALDDPLRRVIVAALSAVVLIAAPIVVWQATRTVGLLGFVRNGQWQADILRLYFFIPFLTVWGTLPAWLRSLPDRDSTQRSTTEREHALTLFYMYAATSLLYLYPAGDFWHVIMALPAFLPLLAYQLERFHEIEDGNAELGFGSPRVVSAVAVAALVALLALPAVYALHSARAMRPTITPPFIRASGISGSLPKTGEAAALMEFLASHPSHRAMFVIANEQMLYLLAGRESILPKDEFLLYLLGTGLVDAQDVRARLSADQIIARLEAEQPLIVDYEGAHAGRRFVQTYPEVGRYIENSYQRTASFGRYVVLDRRASVAPSAPS